MYHVCFYYNNQIVLKKCVVFDTILWWQYLEYFERNSYKYGLLDNPEMMKIFIKCVNYDKTKGL